MTKKTLLTLTIFLILGFASSIMAQQNRTSTLEERKKAVEMATFLENNPFGKEAVDYDRKLYIFLFEVTDISTKMCLDIFGPLEQFKGDYEPNLTAQIMFSQAKFIIEYPDQAKDPFAVQLSGVQGVLRTWESIKKEKPNAKFKLMDELLEKQKADTLIDYLKANIAKCPQ